jgi:hypothetical protein
MCRRCSYLSSHTHAVCFDEFKTGPKSILAELIERRDEVLLKLRDREPDLVSKLTQLNAAISGIETVSARVVRQDEYSGFRKPSPALFSYLDRVQKPHLRDEMCQVLVDGGYGRGTNRPYWDLIRAIDYQIGKKRLVERNGLIGKPDWPEGLFLSEEH